MNPALFGLVCDCADACHVGRSQNVKLSATLRICSGWKTFMHQTMLLQLLVPQPTRSWQLGFLPSFS